MYLNSPDKSIVNLFALIRSIAFERFFHYSVWDMNIPETGYIDHHTHPSSRCRILVECDARTAKTWDEARDLIGLHIAANPNRELYVVHGWNQSAWGTPTVADLDALTEKGIIVINVSYHGALLNTAATHKVPKNFGNMVSEKDFEELAIKTLPKYDDLLVAIPRYHAFLSSLGVVAAHDMHLATLNQIDAYRELDRRGELAIDTTAFVNARLLDDPRLAEAVANPSPHFRVAGLKLFLDGAIGVHTAFITDPYLDTHGHGMLRHSKDECIALIRKSLAVGLSTPAIHAIGDAAVTTVLDVYEALRADGHDTRGWRIEHCEMVRPGDIPRILALGVIPVMQPNFHWDLDHYGDRLGDNLRLINPFRLLLDAGIKILFGSDGMPEGPKVGIEYAMNSARFPEQMISLEEALTAYGIASVVG